MVQEIGRYIGDADEFRSLCFPQIATQDRCALKLTELKAYICLIPVVVVCIWLAIVGFGFSVLSVQSRRDPFVTNRGAQPFRVMRRRSTFVSPPNDVAASYSRYSSDHQDVSSIEQQQRGCREKAVANGHQLLTELEFADEAVSGTKRDRHGLNLLMQAAHDGRFGVLYFHCLSRLAREYVITMPMLKELVHTCGVRVISVSEGIDSANPNWELTAMIRAWMHQEYLKVLRAAVLRGQEGAVLNEFSVGDWRFGYGSEPIPGSESGRTGRNPKPRKRYIIVEEHAQWVRQIFRWYVVDNWSLTDITKELTRVSAPKDHRATTEGWEHQYVRGVLRSTKYIGIWPWGEKTNERDPFTGDLWQIDRPAEEIAKYLRHRPDLRIIDDETFTKAQGKLDENEAKFAATRREDGTLNGSQVDFAKPRHILQGLLRCRNCGKAFHVSGANGKYLGCSGYKRGLCPLKTRLPRELAETLIVGRIQEQVLSNDAWKRGILAAAQEAWESDERLRPNEHDADDKLLKDLESKIANLLNEIEDTGDPMVRERLVKRQRERDAVRLRMSARTSRATSPKDPPTAEWVDAELKRLLDVLSGDPPAAAEALRHLIGEIMIEEVHLDDKKRPRLRGRFRLPIQDVGSISGSAAAKVDESQDEQILDFWDADPWDRYADGVKEGFDAGLKMEEIAQLVGCPDHWVAKALAHWYQSRGFPVPDGRSCRLRLDRETKPEELADEAKALYDANMPMGEIAEKLSCHRDTVTAAIQHLFTSRGLPVPDGRNRRKQIRLDRLNRPWKEPPQDDVA
jgi:site-specific DNA recombinase